MDETMAARFWDKVDKDPSDPVYAEKGCWKWTACISSGGYGKAWDGSRVSYAHRVAWSLNNGNRDPSLFVLHDCDNRLCVNPSHLRLGTHLDNMADMKKRGRRAGIRSVWGPSNGRSVIDAWEAVFIIWAHKSMGVTQREAGDMFGISKSGVGNIVNGRSWAHVISQEAAK